MARNVTVEEPVKELVEEVPSTPALEETDQKEEQPAANLDVPTQAEVPSAEGFSSTTQEPSNLVADEAVATRRLRRKSWTIPGTCL